MSRFVQRDKGGAITGAFARLQPGYAEEELDDGNPELIAYETRPEPLPLSRNLADEFDVLVFALIDRGIVTADEISTVPIGT